MSQVGAPLIERTDAIELSHRGMPETAQLRKDKPHPMAPLPASLQFIQGSSEDGGLRDHEAVQVEGISIRHLRPPFGAARSAPLVWGSLCQALSPPCERSLLDEIGTGLAALWAAPGRSTLYPVGPRRSPDQHPTFVGQGEAGRAGPIFATALWPWGTPVHARPASSRAASGRRSELTQTFNTAPSGTIPTVT